MKIEEFIENSLAKLNASGYEQLKGKLVGEYLTFFFVDEKSISLEVFCEKVADYFEKVELKTKEFDRIIAEYVDNLDKLVKRYIPKEPSAKKDEPLPPIPRSRKYYTHAIEIKKSRNLTMKQLADYSRIMLSLYMSVINNNMKEINDFDFDTEELDLDKIISAFKSEKVNLPIKKNMFDIKELYCMDTATFVITMIMYYHIRNNEA